nr:serotransferrin [Odocoileus virginianus texanus]
MRPAVRALLACAVLGLCLADPERTVRWCTISTHEASKCASFRENMLRVFETGPFVSCVKKTSHMDCIKAIMNNEADAVTLDGGLVYEAGLKPNNLKPVVAEFHGTKENPQTFYYAVAVVKKGTEFNLNELKGKKSCHTGLGRSAGWNIPMGKLYKQLPDPQESIQRAAANFFSGSCVPCADQSSFPKLCQLCAGKGTDKCACSNHEPYFGYSGAFKCLSEGGGDVAFVKHSTVLDNLPNPDDRKNYELLCGDNSRKPVDDYHECYLAKVPSHAVVARTVGGKEDVIWELLNHAQEHFGKDKPDNFQLFQSPHGKDLLFKDSADGFLKIPSKMDFELYLGYEYVTALHDDYHECYLAKVPSHAVVARTVGGKEDVIWELLNHAQEHFGKDKPDNFQLFQSPHGKDLLFKDSADGFLKIPSKMDFELYLGYEYVTALQNLRESKPPDTSKDECKVKWCAIGHHERTKCDRWSGFSVGAIECETAENTEECIAKIMKGEADAMSLDGGYLYIAGKCGLVPVLAENYETGGGNCKDTPEKGYLAVAVVKSSDADLNWNNLKGKKSCHTAVDRTAGWNIPMGLLYNKINNCKFDEFFSAGCAPGSQRNSSLCALCIGSEKGSGKECVPNSNERYYGYTGAFRCLVEKGDVAFVKHQTVLQNTDGKNDEPWAKNLQKENFELLCKDGSRKSVEEAESCHLARAPNHAVVSRKDKATCVEEILTKQQEEFGKSVTDCTNNFCLFHSSSKDLLFRDDTKCLASIAKKTYDSYLGDDYVRAMTNLRQCSTSSE